MKEKETSRNVRTINLEDGYPTVQEARKKLIADLQAAKQSGVVAVKIIHGYGSSGVGGALRNEIRKSLIRRRKEKHIQLLVFGEQWSIFHPDSRTVMEACLALKGDCDLEKWNRGISIALL
jgi:hypothetical protein